MSFLRWLEARFGRFAIPNLTAVLIAGQALLYFAVMMRGGEGDPLAKIRLVTPLVLEGEVWRLLTFVFVPPARQFFLFTLIAWMLLYLFGSTLEQLWGAFRFNLYLLVSYLANVAAAFVVWYGWGLPTPMMPNTAILGSISAGSMLLYGTLFLGYARVNPDMIIHLFFVLPIRIRWIALAAWLGYAYTLATVPWPYRLLLAASLLNYFLFFGREHIREWRQGKRRRSYQAKAKKVSDGPKHECLVCGVTSEQAPKMLFRYCSKCDGQCCYCPEHIRDHEHVAADETAKT